MTANDLISSALRLIGVLASGESPSGAEVNDSFTILNQMIDLWNSESGMIFTLPISNFSLTPGTQTYTYGTGGTFNAPRPPFIDHANIVNLNNPAQPLELPLKMLTHEEWAAIPVKAITSALPLKLYDDAAFPQRNISFWPIPSVAIQVNFYAWQALTQFPDLVTDETFPPAYLKALRYNLAVDLAPEFGVTQLNPIVVQQAIQSKGALKSINWRPLDLRCDEAISQRGGRYNWLNDQGA